MTLGITILALSTFIIVAALFDVTFNTEVYKCNNCHNKVRKRYIKNKVIKPSKCIKCGGNMLEKIYT